jgi:hypothetical protein
MIVILTRSSTKCAEEISEYFILANPSQILEAFHHPYYASGQSDIQHRMFDFMEGWIGGLGPDEAEVILQSLTKVHSHKSVSMTIAHIAC